MPALADMRMSFPSENHVLTGHGGTGSDKSGSTLWERNQKKKQQPSGCRPQHAVPTAPNRGTSQARNPFIDSRPVRGLRSGTKFRARSLECSELRR